MLDLKFHDDGQSTVEFALLLPLIALMLMLILQVGVVARDSILLTSATREAARSLAVENNKSLALVKAKKNVEDISLDIDRSEEVGSTLKVTGKKKAHINLVLIQGFEIELKQTIYMRVEK